MILGRRLPHEWSNPPSNRLFSSCCGWCKLSCSVGAYHMKTAICYFSGTGNSRHAADRLVEAFPSADLKPFVSLLASERPSLYADTVGIVFPIHAFTLPHIVDEFLRRIEMPNATYVFALTTRECSSRVARRMDRLIPPNKLLPPRQATLCG